MNRNTKLAPLSFLLLTTIVVPSIVRAQGNVQSSDVVYEGFRNVRTNGNDSTYSQGLTHRYVNGELRFLIVAHPSTVHEFRIGDTALGGTVTQATGSWNLSGTGALNDHNGIWFEQAKNRLWVTSSADYTNVNHPAKVTLITLGANGAVSVAKQFFLNVPAKRVYGGCNAVPAALVAQLGGPYVCGWGGYTSLVEQGGGATIGPAMYAIPDPDTIASGSTVTVRTVLDTGSASANRGVRKTSPANYFDGGDPRQNPPTRPTAPPLGSAKWLSPANDGLGWMVWGDSYYNTGVWIGTTYAAVASLCQGACWYQSGTIAFDGRQFELHLWPGNSLGQSTTQRPGSMTELNLPRGNTQLWWGNIATGNVAGATYDATSGRLYMIASPFGPDVFTGRLYSFTVHGGGSAPPPPPDSVAPSVSVTAPAAGTNVSGAVTLGAAATDNVGVSGVWFTVDGVTVGSEDTSVPYQISWNSSSVSNGTHTIRALARDAAGNVGTSAPITITVNNTPTDATAPTVSLTAPANGGTVNGTVAVSATASDNVGVTSVQFTLNGVNLGAPDTTAPYSINWNTIGAANGTHTLRAIARDAAGNTTTSAARTVTIGNTVTDTDAPTVGLTAPANNATISGTVAVSATASDNVGVASVQFTLNGVNLGAPDTTAPYGVAWNTTGAANGTHTLRAIARDAAGNTTTSAVRTVTVNNATPQKPPPQDTPPPPPTQGNAQPTPPPPAPSPQCATVRPAPHWVCVNGGWLPPEIAAWFGIGPSNPSPPPPVQPSEPTPVPSACATPRPGLNWLCRMGGWLPPNHPGAQ